MARTLYIPQGWKDLPERETPVNAERLKHIEEGIHANSEDKALKEIYEDRMISLGRAENTPKGDYSVAEGIGTEASVSYAHAEGQGTKATGIASHAEGFSTTASGDGSHAEGNATNASGGYSHAEGSGTTASNQYTHAEGSSTEASGSAAHAEGNGTLAAAPYSHAEGQNTIAGQDPSAVAAHAEGKDTVVSAPYAHAEGWGTRAVGQAQHVCGMYNEPRNDALFIVGGGTSDADRKNLLIVLDSGDIVGFRDITVGGDVRDRFGNTLTLLKSEIEALTARVTALENPTQEGSNEETTG